MMAKGIAGWNPSFGQIRPDRRLPSNAFGCPRLLCVGFECCTGEFASSNVVERYGTCSVNTLFTYYKHVPCSSAY